MKAVLNPNSNEVLGFDDNMSDDQIASAIQSDKDGRALADVNPTPYDQIIRPALEQAKLTGNNEIVYDARRRAREEDPFQKSFMHGLTFGVTEGNNPEVAALHGYADTIGNLSGQVVSILGTAGLGEIVGLGKVAGAAGQVAKGLLPKATQALEVGSETILPKTAGEVVEGTAKAVTASAALGGLYNGITTSVQEGKAYLEDHQAPDVAKIGESILKGAVSWAPYGVGGAFLAKTASGLASGAAAISGTAYVVSRAEGHSEADARLNAILMPTLHFVFHAPGLTTQDRSAVIEDLQSTVSNYTKAKNGMTESNNLHDMVGDEYVKSEAQRVIDEHNANLIAASEEAKAKQPELDKAKADEDQAIKVASEKKLAGTFTDPYEPKMLDYLSQFIPAKVVARLDSTERLRLANEPRKSLVKYKEIYDDAASQEAAGDARAANKLENEALLRRTQNNTLQEVASSDTLTKALTANITKQVIDAQSVQTSSPEASAKDGEGKPSVKETIANPQPIQGEAAAAGSQTPSGVVNVSRENASPELKESGLSKSVNRTAIQKGLTNDLGELPSYEKRDFGEIAKQAEEFIAKDKELAKKIALGEAPEQDGLRSQELFTALRIKAEAEADIPTLRELALSDKAAQIAAEAGQRVAAYRTGGDESPVEAIREIKKARAEAAGKRGVKDIEKETTDSVKEIKKAIKKSAPKLEDWNEFLESIRC